MISPLLSRALVLRALRETLQGWGYLEVQTPVLVPSPALEEHLHAVQAEGGALRTSPEFALKRAIASGLCRLYEIGPCLRERERGPWHRREFTMCEWYRVGASLPDLMDEVEALLSACARALGVPEPGPWERISVRDLVKRHTGIDLARATAEDLSPHDEGWDDAFTRLWVERVDPALSGALLVHSWPASQAALARVHTDGDWPVAARFEAYLGGIELANAFFELTDPAEQRRRFLSANTSRASAGERPHPVDEALIEAIGRMPATSGIALGVDRLTAALMGWSSIAPGRLDEPG